jgi:restriction system protein
MARLRLTARLPTYQQACHFIRIIDGLPEGALRSMMSAIREQRGTPKHQVDWTEPSKWIQERLSGEDADLAHKLWTESDGGLNPKYIRTALNLATKNELVIIDSQGVFHKTSAGDAYIAGDLETHRRVDKSEAVDQMLLLLSTRGRVQTPDLLEEWMDYLRSNSLIRSESFARNSLWSRLRYLVTRGLASQNGSYSITPEGEAYLETLHDDRISRSVDVTRAAVRHNTETQEMLKGTLAEMNPFAFEQLIGDLLSAMGYQDVEVTAATGDKGVDVVATIEMGITNITEVIQVKRRRGNLGRPVVDRLRGALPYHKAIRGTIITLGGFSSGCKEAAVFPGAAPITLIDGDQLLKLLFKHEIGVSRREIAVWDFNPEYFTSDSSNEEEPDDDI